LPSPVAISVPSPYHLWFSRAAGNWRRTRSGARQRPRPGRVVALRRRRDLAARPCSAIKAATVFLLTRHPASVRSAVIIGEPRLPWCASNSRRTSAASAARRAARGGKVPALAWAAHL